ncbi:lipid-A-disaccharide synthase [Desulfonema ishimotonii]|uniref:Lipid-A-disaccharide synthase n=2 Tax=Desulfonema ishimotonii TaxID=45657 RepID=A0A401FSY8_9BACT|nr:lipid-A-disaccharide synthase [Desulfonema ishimotonii]
MIVAGEASGDLHGANLVRAMGRRTRSVEFCGIGGRALRAAGVDIFVDMADLSVVGITEVLSKIGTILKGLSAAKERLARLRPDLLILIDFPDFNLRLAAFARKLGIRVLYYVSPQIWAWRSGRVRTIKKRVDHMAVILPFEQNFYHRHKIPVSFVGHPILDEMQPEPSPDFEDRFDAGPVVGLLPGSREGEVRKLLPVMLAAAEDLHLRHPDIRFLISHAPSVARAQMDEILARHRGCARYEVVPGGAEKVFEQCSFVIAASGTVTLETAIAGIPMVIIYKVSPLSYRLGKALIRVSHISLVNLIPGRGIVPELIQDDASPENIAATVSEMLKDRSGLKDLRRELLGVRKLLGGPGASDRVAGIAMNLLRA